MEIERKFLIKKLPADLDSYPHTTLEQGYLCTNPGVAATMFESLFNSNININMISTSEIRITVLIDEKDTDKALVAVHDGFGLED